MTAHGLAGTCLPGDVRRARLVGQVKLLKRGHERVAGHPGQLAIPGQQQPVVEIVNPDDTVHAGLLGKRPKHGPTSNRGSLVPDEQVEGRVPANNEPPIRPSEHDLLPDTDLPRPRGARPRPRMVEDTKFQPPAAVVVPHGVSTKNKPPLPHPDTDVLTSHPAQPTKRLTGDPDPTHPPRGVLNDVDRATQKETVQDALPRTVRLILFAHATTVLVNVHMKSSEMSIGELATRFGLAPHVLRHWESMGLLTPSRVPGGQRRYGDADLARVAMILMGKEAGLGLRELRNLLSTPNPMDHSELLRHHVAVLDRRITQAQAAKDLIEHALSCPTNFAECPHAHERIEAHIPPP